MKKYAVSIVDHHGSTEFEIKIVQSDKGWKDIMSQAFPIFPNNWGNSSWQNLPDDLEDAKDVAYHWNKFEFKFVEIT